MYTKLESYAIRFALVLQLMAWSCNEARKEATELKAVEGAILLAEYFRNTAKVVQRIVHNEDPLDRYSQWQRNLYQQLPQHFTTGEGLLLAEHNSVPERTFKNFLKQKALFTKTGHGQYEKQL
ncbi:hypothetical protein [Pontibacter harenae]|uniref:hypothetical protein n=1 Tax=Pontibacter harenae TaxID=2894083 RepID=UPI001E603A0C|nr:hypothetical protein [Pontibacter harenae]MCC9168626.1 hypothetical protein [Pontibacter harenae]